MDKYKKALLDIIYKDMAKRIEKQHLQLSTNLCNNKPYDKTLQIPVSLDDYLSQPLLMNGFKSSILPSSSCTSMSKSVLMMSYEIDSTNDMNNRLNRLIINSLPIVSNINVCYKNNRNNRKKKNQLMNKKKPSYTNLNKGRY